MKVLRFWMQASHGMLSMIAPFLLGLGIIGVLIFVGYVTCYGKQ